MHDIDGIYYDLDETDKTAEVTHGDNYSGDIAIPTEIVSSGITYSVTSIGDYAFSGCESLASVIIPNSVTSIEHTAFYMCTGLASIYVLAETPPAFNYPFYHKSSRAFDGVDKTACTLYVPLGCKGAYAKADEWKRFVNIVEMDMSGIDAVTTDDEGRAVKEIFTPRPGVA